MKYLLLSFASILFLNCGSNALIESAFGQNLVTNSEAIKYAETITATDLSKHLYIIASDEYEGRKTGEAGQKLAAEYLKNFYIDTSIPSPFGGHDYFQSISTEHLRPNLKPSENVLAFIEGNEIPEEILVISAHYDHVGTNNGEIYNGADDDGSGTVALLEIAEAFKKAKNEGNGPKRSILFLHVTGEEYGLLGSNYYSKFPVFPLEKTIANLNIDMLGRVDEAHTTKPNYVYLIGSDKLSSDLHSISEKINTKFTKLDLDYTFNDDNDPNRFYYRSDHYNFAKNNIPVIFYFNGTHQDYHQPTDTADKINYELLAKRTQLIFYTAWELVNRSERPVVDKI